MAYRMTHALYGLVFAWSFIAVSGAKASNVSYSHDANPRYTHTDWMSRLPDNILLKDISIPGTHETMSHYGGDMSRTQSMQLHAQLNAGIRALDIRLATARDTAPPAPYYLRCMHGFVDQKVNFDEVLDDIVAFLRNHPNETVLMRIKNEGRTGAPNYDDEVAFTDVLQQYLENPDYAPYFWWSNGNAQPKLSDVRGKIVVLRNWGGGVGSDGSLANLGLDYTRSNANAEGYAFNIQDDYNLTTNWDLYDKWLAVKEQINTATLAHNAQNQRPFFINYLSGSGGSFPYFVASGKSSPGTHAPALSTGIVTTDSGKYKDFDRVSCLFSLCTIDFTGTNLLTGRYLKNPSRYWGDFQGNSAPGKFSFIGIQMMDFPGADLIDSIINVNSLAPPMPCKGEFCPYGSEGVDATKHYAAYYGTGGAPVACAKEHGYCAFPQTSPSPVTVALYYGAAPGYVMSFVEGTQGGVSCDNATFGRDPNPGVVKSCYIVGVYQQLCKEWQDCTASALNNQYLYGANMNFSASTNPTGRIGCNNSSGDPAPGTPKTCYYLTAEVGKGL
jgi:1-phosphatidylinositol phosphodiesterase